MSLSPLGIFAAQGGPPPAPTFRSVADQWTAAATGTNTLTKPSGCVDGDLLLIAAFIQSNTDTLACAALGSPYSGPHDQTGPAGVLRSYLWVRTAASEGASWAFTKTGTGGSCHTVAVCLVGGQLDAMAHREATANSTTITLPSVQPTASPSLLVALMGYRGASNDVTTQPTGYTDRLSTANINPAQVAASTLEHTGTSLIASDTAGRLTISAACSNFLCVCTGA